MTSAQIRQSFLDFFKSKQHIIVPSSSLMPTAPNLLFTNAGMNQFVPYFLGDQAAPWKRVADTQKCIRAGGKHNDLEDVGFDTYHHTMFEMLGNWSFGDYFKKESLTWGWELLTKVWGIPPKRLFATVYSPDKKKGDPAEFDQEAYDIWAGIFQAAGLDPAVHIVNGNKKDNFWMMGDTGPCGPCSEIHFNLLPSDDEQAGRALVNSSSPRCIEIWNHVFIQFNANADGSFAPLAAKHVDTGMGFERVAGIHATTKGFKDFSAEPSNYNADVFKPTFDKVAALSGKQYKGSVPKGRSALSDIEQTDVAFRVLADHARCISCAIADGILPGNADRNYVVRRILRRGIMYGQKTLGLETGFFEQLITPVIESLGDVFPELQTQRTMIERAVRAEEESFGRTLNKGLYEFNRAIGDIALEARLLRQRTAEAGEKMVMNGHILTNEDITFLVTERPTNTAEAFDKHTFVTRSKHGDFNPMLGRFIRTILAHPRPKVVSGSDAFLLYDTYGFPLDMTQLLAAERGLSVDVLGFDAKMEEQRARGRATRKQSTIVAATEGTAKTEATKHLVYSTKLGDNVTAKLVESIHEGSDHFIVLDRTPFYAEMGGQVGDHGTIVVRNQAFRITNATKTPQGKILHKVDPTIKDGLEGANLFLHILGYSVPVGETCIATVDSAYRRAVSRHHTAAHLIHWALRRVLGTHVKQAGTHKTADRLRFDFAHFEALKADEIKKIEALINEKVLENSSVHYATLPYMEVKGRPDILQFFGDKYGKTVRVVQIGGTTKKGGKARLDGYSMELCGGTHVTTTGEIGLIKITAEMAIAAGTRRIEAAAGQAALDFVVHEEEALKNINARLNAGVNDVAHKLESLLSHQKELEKKLKAYEARASAGLAEELAAKPVEKDGLKWVSAIVTAENQDGLRSLGSQVLHKVGPGAVVQLGTVMDGKVALVAYCSPEAIKAGQAAGKLIGALASKLGGKGGGKPDYAQGGGGDATKLAEALKL